MTGRLAVLVVLAQHMDWVATGEWRSNPTLDAHVRQEMTNLLDRKSDLAATVASAERAQRTRPLLHPEMGKLYREWVINARDVCVTRTGGRTPWPRFGRWLKR